MGGGTEDGAGGGEGEGEECGGEEGEGGSVDAEAEGCAGAGLAAGSLVAWTNEKVMMMALVGFDWGYSA